jgi:metal-responsive CopG/Arc/MetJ family transcriptional regulator
MTVKDDKVRKLVTLDKEMWKEIEEYRWEKRLQHESDAIRELLAAGLARVKKTKKPS